MSTWRITKYNPKYRSIKGDYLKNEWTSFSDLGKKFDDVQFIFEDYIKIENAYIDAIKLFLKSMNINALYVRNLTKYLNPIKEVFYSREMINAWENIQEGQALDET